MSELFNVDYDIAEILKILSSQRRMSIDSLLTRMIRLYMENEQTIIEKELDRDSGKKQKKSDRSSYSAPIDSGPFAPQWIASQEIEALDGDNKNAD